VSEDELKEAFEYLDDLRDSGACNMHGAAAYMQRDLCLERNEARDKLMLWMDTFSTDGIEARCKKALQLCKERGL